jgi:hypothetical protein
MRLTSLRFILPCSVISLVCVGPGCSPAPTPYVGEVGPRAGAEAPGAPGTGTGADNGSTSADPGSNTSSGDLSIISLTSTTAKLTGGERLGTESGAVTFIAIVTDAAGLDAIAGGQLTDDEGFTYAAFGAGANKGTYSAVLDWSTMNSIRGADFTSNGGQRQFIAKFFDNKKNEATSKITISLACRGQDDSGTGSLMGACGGECTTRLTGAYCGTCGNVCPSGAACQTGQCVTPPSTPDADDPTRLTTFCMPISVYPPDTTCTKICAKLSKTCRYGVRYSLSCSQRDITVSCGFVLDDAEAKSVVCSCE